MMKKIGLIMIICLFGISNDLLAQATCDDVNITISDATANNVLSGQTDNRHAEVTLTAANDIESGGIAHYKAGTSITLGPGFHAKAGSEFTASIDSCTVAEFITEWEINTTNPITIPTYGSGYSYTVDWGINEPIDTTVYTGDASHTYQAGGTYTIKISGDFPRIYFKKLQLNKENQRIKKIIRWGDIDWASMEGAFYKCFFLTIDPNIPDEPNLSNVSNMDEMFFEADSLNYDFGGWDISNVTSMSHMLDDTNLSQTNYENTLNAWALQSGLQNNVELGANGLTYCDDTGRDTLTNAPNNWTITGDALGTSCRSSSNPRVAIENLHDIFIYPNPVKNFFTVSGKIGGLKEIKILDVSGRTLLRIKDKSRIDVSAFKGGIYLLEVTTIDRKEVIRFVKE